MVLINRNLGSIFLTHARHCGLKPGAVPSVMARNVMIETVSGAKRVIKLYRST